LSEYVQRMPASQKAIYYLTAESHPAAKNSPHLEIFRKHEIEVLLLTDPIDEWLVGHLTEYDDKPLQSVAKGALDLGELNQDLDQDTDGAAESGLGRLVERLQEILKDQVKSVRLTRRLTDSPACLVADEHEIGANLERILKSVGQAAPPYKPILELNPEHPMIQALEADADDLEEWGRVLFDQAALSEGAKLQEPAAYVRRVNRLLSGRLGGGKSRIITP
jgi:molecular chaperone HtpG